MSNDVNNDLIDVSDIIPNKRYTSFFNKDQSSRENFLKRKLILLKKMEAELDEKYTNNEIKYTFYAGFDLGYVVGQISAYEDILDLFDID
jgi:hypothetical protein